MQLVSRILAVSRTLRLGRQARHLEEVVEALPMPLREVLAHLTVRELAQAARCGCPRLYGSAPDKAYAAWGEGADIGFERACSDNPQVRVRGVALWIAVVYHETLNAERDASSAVHKQVLRLMRVIKESAAARPEVQAQWASSRGEAA